MAKSNVVPLREPSPADLELVSDEESEQGDAPDQALAEQPKPAGLTTAQKVGVGAGVLTVSGLVGLGLYKLGVRMGWWGAKIPIIIDDPQDGKGGGSTPQDDATPSDGGGSSRVRAVGKPPNVSGDPAGYHTKRFPNPGAVRLTMNVLGYRVEVNNQTLVPNNEPHPQVTNFQGDWNKVIRGLDSGKVKFGTPVADTHALAPFRGLLVVDGIPGKNTINAMEIALDNLMKNKMAWQSLVKQT